MGRWDAYEPDVLSSVAVDEPNVTGADAATYSDGLVVAHMRGNVVRVAAAAPEIPDLGPGVTLDITLGKALNAGAHIAAEREAQGVIDRTDDVDEYGNRRQALESIQTGEVPGLMSRPSTGGKGGSGSGSGGGREKPTFRRKAPAIDDSAWEDRSKPCLRVRGLTTGEREFFARRPGAALATLREHVGAIEREEVRRVDYQIPGRRGESEVRVYGLTDYEADVLRLYGTARSALVAHARSTAGAFVAALDRKGEAIVRAFGASAS